MPSWTRGSATASAAAVPPLGFAARTPAPARPWYVDVWSQMLRKKPLGTAGAVIVRPRAVSA